MNSCPGSGTRSRCLRTASRRSTPRCRTISSGRQTFSPARSSSSLAGSRRRCATAPSACGTPLHLARRYGSSCYAAVRRYVATNRRASAVLVLELPVYEVGTGYTATLRRTVQSPAFTARFGHPAWPETYRPGDSLHSVLPLGRRFTRPSPCRVRNLDRDDERCVAEAFNSSYQLFRTGLPRVRTPGAIGDIGPGHRPRGRRRPGARAGRGALRGGACPDGAAQGQTYQIAHRLFRGEHLFEEAQR